MSPLLITRQWCSFLNYPNCIMSTVSCCHPTPTVPGTRHGYVSQRVSETRLASIKLSAKAPEILKRSIQNRVGRKGNQENWDELTSETIISLLEHNIVLTPAEIIIILGKCSREKNALTAMHLYEYMCSNRYEVPISLGNHIISMLIEANQMPEAERFFNSMHPRDECSWSSLIVGYVRCGEPERSLFLYARMQKEGLIKPCARTFAALLKACIKLGDLDTGSELHEEIANSGWLEKSPLVGNSLVHMYVKFSCVEKAEEVFCNLPTRDVATWNALIAGYINQNRNSKALLYFEQMKLEGIVPNVLSYVYSLKACSNMLDMEKVEKIHAEVTRNGLLGRHLVVGNTLIDVYGKCGLVTRSQEVFDCLLVRDVVSWNSLISGYVNLDNFKEVVGLFEQMLHAGICPDSITFTCILKACSRTEPADKVFQIQGEIVRNQLLERTIHVSNTLINAYVKQGMLAKAYEVFDKLPVRDIVSWNSLIAGYSKHGYHEEALDSYERMQQEGLSADSVTFFSCLKVCSSTAESGYCFQLHSDIAKKGFEKDDFLTSSLVNAYAKCGSLDEAEKLFYALPVHDVVSWTALMNGYEQNDDNEYQRRCIGSMQAEGINPDLVTFVCSIKACTRLGDIIEGQQVHAEIASKGIESNPLIATMLVDMYAKFGLLKEAEMLFSLLPVHGVTAWNALIALYVKHDQNEKALVCFHKVQLEGIPPNSAIYVSTLKACGNLGCFEKGQEIHSDIRIRRSLGMELAVRNSLVNMYAKCGSLSKAQEFFDELPFPELSAWNTLLAGYAQYGLSTEAFRIFAKMIAEGINPSLTSFISLLNVCNHEGIVPNGKFYFEVMNLQCGMVPSLQHYSCMIDLLCRAGQLDESIEMMKRIPMCPDLVLWRILLAACQKSSNVVVGKRAFDHLVKFYEADSVSYICMSNICAFAEM